MQAHQQLQAAELQRLQQQLSEQAIKLRTLQPATAEADIAAQDKVTEPVAADPSVPPTAP